MGIILSETWTHGLLLKSAPRGCQSWHPHINRLCATAPSVCSRVNDSVLRYCL